MTLTILSYTVLKNNFLQQKTASLRPANMLHNTHADRAALARRGFFLLRRLRSPEALTHQLTLKRTAYSNPKAGGWPNSRLSNSPCDCTPGGHGFRPRTLRYITPSTMRSFACHQRCSSSSWTASAPKTAASPAPFTARRRVALVVRNDAAATVSRAPRF